MKFNMIPLLHNSSVTGVKVCGLRCEEHVDIAVGAGADAIGFLFVEKSPRYLQRRDAEQLLLQLPEEVLGVAVVQNYKNLSDFSDWNGWLQLCGEEDEETVASAPCPVIRALKWDEKEVIRWNNCPNIEALLIDGSTGGLGESFDVSTLANMIPTLTKPVIIAGGLSAKNVAEVITQAKPAAVDASSGIESTLGNKDPQLLCDFINAVKSV
jgi:phosphoribosylanthranilate isomerase